MEALFPSPAAASPPPASDTKAWAPAGRQLAGAVPDAVPFRPRAIDPDTLTPEQRHAMHQAIRSGSQAEYQAFIDGLNQNTGATPNAPPAQGAAEAPADMSTAEAPVAQSPERTALAEKLVQHGSDIEAVDLILPHLDRFHVRLAALPEDEARALVENGEANVISRNFRGDEGAYERAVREIGETARAVGGKALVEALADSGALLDPELFHRIHCMANAIKRGRSE